MKLTLPSFACSALWLVLCGALAAAEDRPATGKKVRGFEPIDQAVLELMDRIGCQSATVAVSKDGRVVYSRGFGWCDEARQKPVPPDALMRIASLSKAVTAAAVKNAARARLLSLDTRAFEYIAVKAPGGTVADPRVSRVTVAQLLDHTGGWDREASYDPMFRTKQVERELRLGHPATPADVIAYMLSQPLQFAPGEKAAYSNFGYCVLGRVLEKAYGKPYFDCVQQAVLKPLGIKDIRLGRGALEKRDAREVWYPVAEDAFPLDVMDAHGGLIASAPALCTFLGAYWVGGDRRAGGQGGDWTSFGSLPGTTAMARQRPDGVNVVVLLNGRREEHFKEDNDALKDRVDKAIDRIGKGR
jgi:N-acyl-D-amino-acid deacylase